MDPSYIYSFYKTDPDLWDCFGRETPPFFVIKDILKFVLSSLNEDLTLKIRVE